MKAKVVKRIRISRVSRKVASVNEACLIDEKKIDGKSLKVKYEEVVYGVCNKACLAKFKESPSRFIEALD